MAATALFSFFLWLSVWQIGNTQEIKVRVQPTPQDEKSNLIWFNSTSYSYWSTQLDNFMEVYRFPDLVPGRADNIALCDFSSPSTKGQVCHIQPEDFKPCISTKYFGYKHKKPCVFLQISTEKGWRPKYYKDYKTLPMMPKNLKHFITEKSVPPLTWETLWVSCDGETSADQEFIGPVNYIPGPGVPGYFFPNLGQKGYLPPLVALQFTKPAVGVLINIECKTWAANIKNYKGQPVGTVKFQLMID